MTEQREPWAPSDDLLDAQTEWRNAEHEREQADHAAYMTWLGERAERALELAPDEDINALNEVILDFRNLAPREADPQHTNGGVPVTSAEAMREVMDRYGLTGEMDAADLLALDLPTVKVVIEGLLANGTTVLAGPPKLGKSWMCIQFAVECALGGTFLGRAVTQGDVLYLPLEDGRKRTQDRLYKVLNGRSPGSLRGRLTIRWDAPPLGDGMEALIEEWLDTHPNAAMVIIDTLGRVRTPGDGRRNAYQVDVQDVGRLQSLIRERTVALVLVHHTKKGKEDDFVSQVSGTQGIAGSADTVLVIHRKRLIELATIEVTSRDLPEVAIGARFVSGEWLAAPEALAGVSPERMAVYDAITLHGPIWPIGLARLLRSERTSVQHLCRSLLEDGLIARVQGGYVTADSVGLGGTSTNDTPNPHSVH